MSNPETLATVAEELRLVTCGIVSRQWAHIRKHAREMVKVAFADEDEARAEFTMAALAIGLGRDDAALLRSAVKGAIAKGFGIAGPSLAMAFEDYAEVWEAWPRFPFSTRFGIPPMEHAHEAIGIVLAEHLNLDLSLRPRSESPTEPCWNIFSISILGMLAVGVIEDVNQIYP
jgi:hypothetical protein